MPGPSHRTAQGLGWAGMVAIALLALSDCGGPSTSTPAVSATDSADTTTRRYVAARALRCRAAPESTAAVQDTLIRATPVIVARSEGDWSELTSADGTCWVASSYLTDTPAASGNPVATAGIAAAAGQSRGLLGQTTGSGSGLGTGSAPSLASIGNGSTAAVQRRAKTRATKARTEITGKVRRSRTMTARRSRRSQSYEGDGSCPCSGRNICIGPRGGRYCITSGGNKRYGV